MASDAEDVVRRYYAAWSRGDLDTMLALADPEMEAHPTLGVLYDNSSYFGHEGIRDWFEEVAGRWKDFDPDVLETRQHEGQVVAFIRLSARRHESMLDARIAVLHSLREGRIRTLVGRDYFEVCEELGLDA